jgi:hypothetical protein
MPLAIRGPVSRASVLYNMTPAGTAGSIFDAIPPLDIALSGTDIPKIPLAGKGIWWTTREGQDLPRGDKGLEAITAISLAAKMACPCFSFPAGATREHGTCISADRVLASGSQDDPNDVCGQCYAQEGNYIHFETNMARAATFAFARQRLTADPSGMDLATKLVAMIEHYARKTTLDSVNARMVQELGTWSSKTGGIVVPAALKSPKRSWLQPCVDTELRGMSYKTSSDLFASLGPSDGEVVGYFRVNDSGDLYVHPRHWVGLIAAWAEVARRLPRVLIWVPTRMYEIPAAIALLQQAAKQRNLIIRPSAAKVGEDPPKIAGLSAGSTVRRKGDKIPGTRNCPVYTGAGSSCMAENCRLCWAQPDVPVAYTAH